MNSEQKGDPKHVRVIALAELRMKLSSRNFGELLQYCNKEQCAFDDLVPSLFPIRSVRQKAVTDLVNGGYRGGETPGFPLPVGIAFHSQPSGSVGEQRVAIIDGNHRYKALETVNALAHGGGVGLSATSSESVHHDTHHSDPKMTIAVLQCSDAITLNMLRDPNGGIHDHLKAFARYLAGISEAVQDTSDMNMLKRVIQYTCYGSDGNPPMFTDYQHGTTTSAWTYMSKQSTSNVVGKILAQHDTELIELAHAIGRGSAGSDTASSKKSKKMHPVKKVAQLVGVWHKCVSPQVRETLLAPLERLESVAQRSNDKMQVGAAPIARQCVTVVLLQELIAWCVPSARKHQSAAGKTGVTEDVPMQIDPKASVAEDESSDTMKALLHTFLSSTIGRTIQLPARTREDPAQQARAWFACETLNTFVKFLMDDVDAILPVKSSSNRNVTQRRSFLRKELEEKFIRVFESMICSPRTITTLRGYARQTGELISVRYAMHCVDIMDSQQRDGIFDFIRPHVRLVIADPPYHILQSEKARDGMTASQIDLLPIILQAACEKKPTDDGHRIILICFMAMDWLGWLYDALRSVGFVTDVMRVFNSTSGLTEVALVGVLRQPGEAFHDAIRYVREVASDRVRAESSSILNGIFVPDETARGRQTWEVSFVNSLKRNRNASDSKLDDEGQGRRELLEIGKEAQVLRREKKPIDMMTKLVRMFTGSNSDEVVLDLFCGSVSTMRGIRSMRAAEGVVLPRWVGLDIDAAVLTAVAKDCEGVKDFRTYLPKDFDTFVEEFTSH